MGAVSIVSRPEDARQAIANLPFGISNIIALVNVADFKGELIDVLKNTQQVTGILLIHKTNEIPQNFSEDSACPNQRFSFYKSPQNCEPWNSEFAVHKDGLKFLAFDKPIFYLTNQTEANWLVQKCANLQNDVNFSGFRCMAKMAQFMYAAGSARICKQRQDRSFLAELLSPHSEQLCDPLEDRNVFALLPPVTRANKTRSDLFVLSARMDSFSFFTQSRSGDISALSSVIALLSTADAIGRRRDKFLSVARKSQRQLLFAFFHGESLGYIGSSRFLWDLQRGEFPSPPQNFQKPEANVRQLYLSEFSAFFEVQQIGENAPLFLHTDASVYASNRTKIDSLVNASKSAAKKGSLEVEFIDPSLQPNVPPSSYHSILKHTLRVPGLVLSSFGHKYTTGHINSIFDTDIQSSSTAKSSKVYKQYLANIIGAGQIALRAALSYVLSPGGGKPAPEELLNEFSVNDKYVKTLADCFFVDGWKCPLFKSLLNVTDDQLKDKKLVDTYIGTGHQSSLVRLLINSFLVRSLGSIEETSNVASEAQCKQQNTNQDVYTFVWQNDPDRNRTFCYKTSVFTAEAKSPAFVIENYDFNTGAYSEWMESVWSSQQLELYLKADYRLELFAGTTALVAVGLSALLYRFFREEWFHDNSSGFPPETL